MPRPHAVVLPRLLHRGLTGSLLVLVGGLVVSVVPGSSWVMHTDALSAVRGSEVGRMLGLTLVMAGLGLLAHSWLQLCRHLTRTREEPLASRLALTRVAAALWSLPLVVAPPLFSRDGWSYAAVGMLQHVGYSPYEFGPWILHGPINEAVDLRWILSTTPYGPLPVALGGAFAGVTDNPWALVIMHRGVALVGVALLAWAVPRLAGWTRVDPALASAVVLTSPMMLANGVGGLHNDLLMAGLMACALVVAAERGWWWGAVLGGLAAAVKAPGGLVCVAVVLVSLPVAASLWQRTRRFVVVGAVSAGVLLGAGVVLGTGAGWVHALSVPGQVNVVLSVTTLVGGAGDWIAGVLGLGTPPAHFLTLVRHLGTAAAAVTTAYVALRWPTGRREAALTAATVTLGTLVLLSPVVHLWYLLWALPFVACLRLSRELMAGLLGLSVVLGLVAPLDSSLHDAYLAIVLGTMLVVALAVVLLVTPSARRRVRRILGDPVHGDYGWRAGSTLPATSPRLSRPPEVDGAL